MNEPRWLRAAAVSASLAGVSADDAVRGFTPEDGASLRATMASFRASGDRRETVRAIVRARLDVVADRALPAAATDRDASRVGARVLASLVRHLQATEHHGLVRAFAPGCLRAAAEASGEVDALDAPAWLRVLRRMRAARGRMPTVHEIGAALHGARGDAAEYDRRGMRIAGVARVHGAT